MIGLGLNLYTRPPIGSLSAYFAAISPSATVRSAYTTFFNSLVTAGIYSKFSLLYPMILDTEAASRINAITPGSNSLVNDGTAPTWVSGVGGAGGFTANGAGLSTGLSILVGVVPTAGGISLNSICVLFDSGTSGSSTNSDFGTTLGLFGRLRSTGDVSTGRINDGTTETIATSVTDGSGLFGFERSSSTNKQVFRNGSSIGSVSRTSGGSSSTIIHVLGNVTTTGVRRCRLFALCSSLGVQGHSDFAAAWTQFKTDIGCT